MKLQDRLPNGVWVRGHYYKLDLDFRNVLNLIDTLARNDLFDDARDYRALKCIMKRPKKGVLNAAKALLFPASQKPASKERITDFVQDADLIRAAFMQVYGINLFRDRLHWLEFSALLAGLPEGNRYSEVLGIRARPMPKATKYNEEERKWLAKAKADLALKLTDEEREQNFEKSLRNVANTLLVLADYKGGEDHG